MSQKAQVKAAEQDVFRAQVSLDAVNDRFSQGTADVGDRAQATTKLMQQKLNLVEQKKTRNCDLHKALNEHGTACKRLLNL